MTNRRSALKLIGGGLAAAPLIAKAKASQARFDCGIASGDPTHDSVMIWTRLNAGDTQAPQNVKWQMAQDKKMRHLVAEGEAKTDAARDFTVNVDVTGPRFSLAQREKQKDGSLLRRLG